MPQAARPLVIGVAAVVVTVLVILALQPATPPPPPPPPLSNAQGQIPNISLPPELAALARSSQPAPAPNPDATWTTLLSLSGTEAGHSPSFDLSGTTARITYSIEGEIALLVITVAQDAPAVETVGGIPEVIATSAAPGEVLISRPAGRYYLIIQALGGPWTIEVAQEDSPAG